MARPDQGSNVCRAKNAPFLKSDDNTFSVYTMNTRVESLQSAKRILVQNNIQMLSNNLPRTNLFNPHGVTPAFQYTASAQDTLFVSKPSALAFALASPDLEEFDRLIATCNDETAFFLCPTCPCLTLAPEISPKIVTRTCPRRARSVSAWEGSYRSIGRGCRTSTCPAGRR
jgi:hypothetical protein